jgi:hypothetical protein
MATGPQEFFSVDYLLELDPPVVALPLAAADPVALVAPVDSEACPLELSAFDRYVPCRVTPGATE